MGGVESRALTIENPHPQPANVITISSQVDQRITEFADGDKNTSPSAPPPPPPPSSPSQNRSSHYCQQKYEEAERLYLKSNELMETQFIATVNQVNALLGQQNKTKWSDDFMKVRQDLIECYKKCPNEPLLCLEEVQRFQRSFFQNSL